MITETPASLGMANMAPVGLPFLSISPAFLKLVPQIYSLV